MTKQQIRVRKTPNCAHPYTATIKGYGGYGWGNTPDEARASLRARIVMDAIAGEKILRGELVRIENGIARAVS